MQQTITQYLNSTFELVQHVMLKHPELQYPQKKMQIWEKCCEAGMYKFDPETIFRHCRKIREMQRNDYSIKREPIYRQFMRHSL